MQGQPGQTGLLPAPDMPSDRLSSFLAQPVLEQRGHPALKSQSHLNCENKYEKSSLLHWTLGGLHIISGLSESEAMDDR